MTDIFIDKTSSRGLVKSKPALNIRWQQLALPLGVFLVILLPRLLTLNTFLTADEDDQINFAHLFLKSALQGDWSGALVLGYPGVPTLILGAGGVGLRYLFHYMGWLPLPWVTADLLTTLEQVTPQFGVFAYPLDFLLWVRVPLALVASLSIFGIYRLARRLLDERLALLGTLIIAFDPFILAHTRVIHVDGPLAYFMFLSFLAFLLYLDQGGWKWLVLSGLFGGLAALSKTPAVLLGPILVISGLFYALWPPSGLARSTRWKRLGIALVVWGLVAAAAFFALWPSMWARPAYALQWIIQNIQSVNRTAHRTTGIFWGNRQSDQNPLYYLIVFPYHLTPLTTVGVMGAVGLIGAGLVAYWRKTNDALNNWLRRSLPLALSLVVYVIAFIIPVSAISRRGDRYILPVFFATGLLSALALWWLAALALKYLPPGLVNRFGLTPTRLVSAAILVQALLVLFYHPYYLAYFNPLMGGGRTAPYRINIGWGEGLDLAARYLNETTGLPKPQVAAWYSGQFAPFYRGPTIDLSNHSAALTGEYTVFYINQVQRSFPSRELLAYFQQRNPLHVIELGGITYAWIYPGPVISQNPPKRYAFPVEALLGGGAGLIGLDIPQTTMPVDAYALSPQEKKAAAELPYGPVEGLPVTLYWETVGKIHGEHNIYIRLMDDAGNVWGQVDRMILSGLWRPDRWYTGYFLRDEYKLAIDPATPPGAYHFEVGMYDFVTGQSYGVAKNIGQLTLTAPRRVPPPNPLNLPTTLSTALNPSLTLVGHNYRDTQLPPGAEVVGKIFWQAAKAGNPDYGLEFSLVTPDRKAYVIAEMPLSPAYPPSQWRRSEIVAGAYRFRIPAIAPPGQYPLYVNVVDPQTGQGLGPVTVLANITVEAQDRNFELPAGVTPISAYLNDEIELVGYKLVDHTVTPRHSFGLRLYWRSLNFADTNYTVFVHAVGPDQVIRGQWDSQPAQGEAPTSGWIPGEVVEDSYQIPMAKDAPPWKYDIFVGMYDPLTGERLPLSSPNAPVSNNRVWLTRVQVVEQ
ncbi:MAG: glycosyltransferase family 39 protein [Anaerolineae bacterium]|nr:glycosyltransferase family 39 protein [Anaerolineae bacterium]